MRTIRVTENYGGRATREDRIQPGEYREDDPRLHGLVDFLIESGRAVVTSSIVTEPELKDAVVIPSHETDDDNAPDDDEPAQEDETAQAAADVQPVTEPVAEKPRARKGKS